MGARILVVDDDERFRLSLVSVLETLGHLVTAVDSGASAIAAVGRDTFDAVLLDQRMPEMTGVETWEHLRALPGAPRPVLVTASVAGESLARQHGMGFLAKPFGLEELRSALDLALSLLGG